MTVSNPHERRETHDFAPELYRNAYKSQALLDGLVTLGKALEGERFDTEEQAKYMSEIVYGRCNDLIQIGESAFDGRLLRVTGQAAQVVNYTVEQEADNTVHVTVNRDNPVRSLEPYENRLFLIETVLTNYYYDEKEKTWRLGIKLHGYDPGSSEEMAINGAEAPLLGVACKVYLLVDCNSSTEVEDQEMVLKRERDAALRKLEGKIARNIIHLLRSIDGEMSKGEGGAEYRDLDSVRHLRTLGVYVDRMNPVTADYLSTAIYKVLSRGVPIVAVSPSYLDDGVSSTATEGIVADVIPSISLSPAEESGPALALVDSTHSNNAPTYVPLKNIQQLRY